MGGPLGEGHLAGGGAERNRRFELLYREYAPRVRGLVRQKVADPDLVEDLVQETFLRAYRAFDEYDPRRPTWPWLSTIATRAAINALDKKSCSAESPSEEVGDHTRPAGQGPFERYLAGERRRGISDALGSLNSRHRRLLLLQALEGWRYEEIADLEGTSTPAVKSVLSRARRTFRHAYETMADRRGLNVTIWPVLGWVAARFRALHRAASRASFRAREVANGAAGHEALAPAGLTQIAGGLVALSVVVTGLSAPATPQRDADTDARPRAAAFEERWTGDGPTRVTTPDTPSDGAPPEAESSGPADGEGGAPEPDQIVADLTDPNRDVEDPEEARLTSITFSPGYAQDRTIFAAGTARCSSPTCVFVLFRSSDGGATWTSLRAKGLLGDSILLPPGYPEADSRLFAMAHRPAQAGLQVSEDGGESFRSVTAEAPFVTGSAAISPAFNRGDRRIVIGSEVPSAYRDDLQTVKPGGYTALPGPLNPAFAPGYSEDARLLFGGFRGEPEPPHKVPVVHVCHDAADDTVGGGSEPVCRTRDVEGLPPHRPPELRLARDFSGSDLLYVFNARGLVRSRDAATTFESLSTPWTGDLRDVALAGEGAALFAAVWVPGDGGGLYVSRDEGAGWQRVEDALLAEGALDVASLDGRLVVGLPGRGLACSADGGRTWTERCPTAEAAR